MANANDSIPQVIKEEGGWQKQPQDAGNYFKGKLIGTKYGITPNAYFGYYKKEPSEDTIKNLTVSQAVPIYKINYWDKIQGDLIANKSVADLMMFTVVNSGVGQTKTFRQLMNETAGKNIVTLSSTPLTANEVKLLNALPQDVFFNKLKKVREIFYKALVQKKPSNQIYLKGWLNRLNKHTYSGAVSKTGKGKIIGVMALFALGAVIGYKVA